MLLWAGNICWHLPARFCAVWPPNKLNVAFGWLRCEIGGRVRRVAHLDFARSCVGGRKS